MGFRNPITSATAVDTGQPAGAGVRIYQGSDSSGTYGVVEFRDGIAGDATGSLTSRAYLTPQPGGGGYTAQGGGMALKPGSFNGISGPELDLNVEQAPAGGYQPVARLTAGPGGLIVLDGPVSITDDGPWTAYDCVFTTVGAGAVQPAVGNGTLTAAYRRLGRLIEVDILLMLGSTSNAGSGGFQLTLPFAVAGREAELLCKAYTSDGSSWAGFAYAPAGGTAVIPMLPKSSSTSALGRAQSTAAGSTATGQSVPLVAGNYAYLTGCNLAISGRYEAGS